MFDILFGWRKASKCKKLIKLVQYRLKLLKNKRNSILRQLREDVAQLIKIGYEDVAFNRADQIFMDESLMTLYELLDNFCEFILLHLSYIRRHKDCPNDINEAVSSLIFASARCGDLPELRAIRKLFGERYGERFEKTALELLPGNLVNSQVTKTLSISCVTDEMKQNFVDQIARDYCLRQEILALEYPSELPQQVNKIEEDQIESSSTNQIEGKSIYVDATSTGITISTSMDSSVVSQSSPDTLESPIHFRELKPQNFPAAISLHELSNGKAGVIYITTPERKVESKMVVSSPESSPQPAEDMIAYHDEIEELQSSVEKEGSYQDQSIFKFKSSPLPTNSGIGDMSIANYVDQHESWAWDARSRSMSSTMRVKETRKRSRRRSPSFKTSRTMDMDCFVFYDDPIRTPSRHRHRIHLHCKHQKKNPTEEVEKFCDKKWESCCLNQHCYFCTGNHCNDQEISPWKQKIECTIIRDTEQKHISNQFLPLHYSRIGEFGMQSQSLTAPQMSKTSSRKLGGSEHNRIINPTFHPDEESKMVKGNAITSPRINVASNSSYSMPSKLTGKVKPPYLRNLTMPKERARDGQLDNVWRSKSFPVHSPTHVHPKLPDYDEIAAKFMALKKDYVQKRAN